MAHASRPTPARFYAPQGDFAPIATINTTPLVDVMLVLLIMFIIIIPVASHKVPVDLPPPDPAAIAVPPPVHRLDIAAGGGLAWDGAPLAAASLPARLRALAADPDRPVLHLNADGEARYEQVDIILADIARAGVTRLGFVDNRRFERAF
ncbi:MAG TPA: biopolymer transporter ExbD [Allosphingosinicella sp.]|nr:biopolymer transporter ExbD [Allosphingosinicella sp.]